MRFLAVLFQKINSLSGTLEVRFDVGHQGNDKRS